MCPAVVSLPTPSHVPLQHVPFGQVPPLRCAPAGVSPSTACPSNALMELSLFSANALRGAHPRICGPEEG